MESSLLFLYIVATKLFRNRSKCLKYTDTLFNEKGELISNTIVTLEVSKLFRNSCEKP